MNPRSSPSQAAPIPVDPGIYRPKTAAEADSLRPYIPTHKLIELHEIYQKDSLMAEEQHRKYQADRLALIAAETAEREARAEKKAAKFRMKAYFDGPPIYQASDAATDVEWSRAKAVRDMTAAAGLPLKTETAKEASARRLEAQLARVNKGS